MAAGVLLGMGIRVGYSFFGGFRAAGAATGGLYIVRMFRRTIFPFGAVFLREIFLPSGGNWYGISVAVVLEYAYQERRVVPGAAGGD